MPPQASVAANRRRRLACLVETDGTASMLSLRFCFLLLLPPALLQMPAVTGRRARKGPGLACVAWHSRQTSPSPPLQRPQRRLHLCATLY